ncbi:hypothetical protein COT77_00290 [Candidatus Berkelbacteria bacterium CG10_big_fil_rev_8_21_14_0_10_41_12]|uniref:Uncharacterized protein n=1 Tax=Candidatus Berkelbacteria bacterium CG10_big_fil_rev_8_21_14_0_10_41_12 TaxID=1974513 RepID=A0A2M6WY30_9BACT|nr:MAG: hypothetical protein COT77_00290 [Candidatus Berkelbacteria bacterium CG10_big_fil_rev_8_21_14_0_10_41_12]
MKLSKKIFSNWPSKLISVIIALVIWIYTTTNASSVVNFPGKIIIEPRNIQGGLVALLDNDSVSIKIRSDSIALKDISTDNFKAFVDLSGLSSGTYEKDVTVTSANSNIQIIDRDPRVVTVKIEPIVTKTVPVRVKFEAKAADGFSAIEKTISPPEVEVQGPESEIKLANEAVATIKLSGENNNFTKVASLSAFSADGEQLKDIKFYPSEVSVDVVVDKTAGTKTVSIKPVFQGNLADGYAISSVTIDPETALISGSANTIAQTKYIETKLIDISGLNQTKTITISLNIPSGIVLEDKTNLVKVTLTISQVEAVENFSIKVNPVNLSADQRIISIAPPSIQATIAGSRDLLDSINSDLLSVDIDLTNRKNSTFSIPYSKTINGLPGSLSVISFSPETISVQLGNK